MSEEQLEDNNLQRAALEIIKELHPDDLSYPEVVDLIRKRASELKVPIIGGNQRNSIT